MKKYLKTLFLPLLPGILFLFSCQQTPDDTLPPDPPIDPPKVDSSLLIKSIGIVYYEEDGTAEDSATEFYSYDTVAHKITLTWDVPEYAAGGKHELFYNASNLLSQINYTYPPTYAPDGDDISSVYISYDGAGVLQGIFVKFVDGSTKTRKYNKTNLADGRYEVAWKDTTIYNNTQEYRRRFNAQGQLQVKERGFYGLGNDPSFIQYNIDTLVYDAEGSVSAISAKEVHGTDTTEYEEYYKVLARETRGDQLYKQRQLLINGMTDFIVFDDNDKLFDAFTALGGTFEDENQYCKYPIISVKVALGPVTSTAVVAVGSEFDSKGRLIRLRGFFNDGIIIKQDYKIEYYK